MPENAIALFAIVGLVALVIITALTVVTRYKVAKPNQAFIVTGRKGKTSGDLSGQKVVTGGGVFVVQFVQQLSVLDLSSHKIEVSVRHWALTSATVCVGCCHGCCQCYAVSLENRSGIQIASGSLGSGGTPFLRLLISLKKSPPLEPVGCGMPHTCLSGNR